MHHLANVRHVHVSAGGQIENIETDTEETLNAELYVDCTGFRSVLLGGALNVPVKDYGKYLLCDRSGVFCIGGLGSRGFTFAPLLADHIVSMALGEPLPLARQEAELVSPIRFLIRAIDRYEKVRP